MKKLVVIIPYFGKFPSILVDFLNSCKYNSDINWLIFTDNDIEFDIPDNVKIIRMNFNELKELIQTNYDFPIVLERPHKLCDFKPAYGDIFRNYIKDFKYWAHGDLDVIYGRISYFIDKWISDDYDKIYGLGHFSIYRNCNEVNNIYRRKYNGAFIYREIFSTDRGYAFDEWHCPVGSINHMFLDSGYSVFVNNECADLNSDSKGFKLSEFVYNLDGYVLDRVNSGVFEFNRGRLIRNYEWQGKIRRKEYIYIHFHKRNIKRNTSNYDWYVIKPNEIVDSINLNLKTLNHLSKAPIINLQYFKVRFLNLRYRLKLIMSKNR